MALKKYESALKKIKRQYNVKLNGSNKKISKEQDIIKTIKLRIEGYQK